MSNNSKTCVPVNDNEPGSARTRHRFEILPRSLPPLGLSRVQAALYIGISPSLFDEMVKDGRMPQPKRINSRTVWVRVSLEEAFEALPGGENVPADDWTAAV